MADMSITRSFKLTPWLNDRLCKMAKSERRKVSDMIRILLERALAADAKAGER